MDMVTRLVAVQRVVKRAKRYDLDASAVAALRKEFLQNMKLVSRIPDFETYTAVQAMFKEWSERLEKIWVRIREKLTEMTSGASKSSLSAFDLKVATDYLNQKPLWDFGYELRHIPEYKPGRDMAQEAVRIQEALRSHNYSEAEIEALIAREKPQAVVDKEAFDVWRESVRKWDDRLKTKARSAWKYLESFVAWLSTHDKLSIVEPTIENVTLEGYKVRFKGYAESGSMQGYLPEFKAGLQLFKQQAQKVFPWIHANMLPLEVNWDTSAPNSAEFAATYNGDHIELFFWGVGKNSVKVLAHEMGHHFYRTALSSQAQDDWSTFIKGDYQDLDLREVLKGMRGDKTLSEYHHRIEREDPILYLQLEATLHSRKYESWDLLSMRNIKEHLEKGGEPIIQVPAHPITGYANKNPEEAFCETVGNLVAFGPRTVPELVRGWISRMVPNIRVSSTRVCL